MPRNIKKELGHLKKAVALHNTLKKKNPTLSKKEQDSEAALFNKIIVLLNEVDQEFDRITGGSK